MDPNVIALIEWLSLLSNIRSPSQFEGFLEERGADPSSYSCDFIVAPHLRYVGEDDVEEGGCAEEEVHCVMQECRSAVAKAEFENDSLVR